MGGLGSGLCLKEASSPCITVATVLTPETAINRCKNYINDRVKTFTRGNSQTCSRRQAVRSNRSWCEPEPSPRSLSEGLQSPSSTEPLHTARYQPRPPGGAAALCQNRWIFFFSPNTINILRKSANACRKSIQLNVLLHA